MGAGDEDFEDEVDGDGVVGRFGGEEFVDALGFAGVVDDVGVYGADLFDGVGPAGEEFVDGWVLLEFCQPFLLCCSGGCLGVKGYLHQEL